MLRQKFKKAVSYPKIIDWEKKAYMPISMNNRITQDPEIMEDVLEFIFQKKDSCLFVIGDYLHRHNLINNGMEEKKAIEICEQMGKDRIQVLNNMMLKFPNKEFRIVRVKEYYDKPMFISKFYYYSELFLRDTYFTNGINDMIFQFLNRQGHIDVTEDLLSHCCTYLLEELAVFELLADEGFELNIYPGKQLKVLKNIVTGKMPDVSPTLEKIHLIEMRFKSTI